jgi:HEAT repeat protein
MKRPVLVVILLLIIAAVGAELAYVGPGYWKEWKEWHPPTRVDQTTLITYRGRLLHAWHDDLKSEDVAVRREAAAALIEIPTEDGQFSIAALKIAISDKDNLTRARAEWALGRVLAVARIPAPPEKIVPTSSLVAITEVLDDPDPEVRIAGVQALASFGQRVKQAAPAVAELAKNDKDQKVREAAAGALEKISPPHAAPPAKTDAVPGRAETKKN